MFNPQMVPWATYAANLYNDNNAVTPLPIPVLDGGQITILLFESLRRRDLSLPVKERINQVGLVMIVLLMVVVAIN